jgi:hypothetical protein
VTLAPLYDVATGLTAGLDKGALRYRRAAMAIGGENRFGAATANDWQRFANTLGFDVEEVRSMVKQMAQVIPDAVRDALGELPASLKGIDIITNTMLPRLQRYIEFALATMERTTPPSQSATAFFDTL